MKRIEQLEGLLKPRDARDSLRKKPKLYNQNKYWSAVTFFIGASNMEYIFIVALWMYRIILDFITT